MLLLQNKDLAGCHAWMQSKTAPVAVHTKPGAVRSGFFTGLQPRAGAPLRPPPAQDRRASGCGGSAGCGRMDSRGRRGARGHVTPGSRPIRSTRGHAGRSEGRREANGTAPSFQGPGALCRPCGAHRRHGVHARGEWLRHPHQHQLWFVRSGVDRDALKATLDPVWSASLQRLGFTASEAHGVRVDGGERAAQYVAKMSTGDAWTLADELTRSGSKVGRNGSRSIWEILTPGPIRVRPRPTRLRRRRCSTSTRKPREAPRR